MAGADDELAAIRALWSYRLAVWALRLELLAVAVALLVIACALLGAPPVVLKAGALLLFSCAILGIAGGWVGIIPLTRHTSRYSGVSQGAPDFRRIRTGFSALRRDLFNPRFR